MVDTLKVPYDNPYKTVMQLSSMDFLPNGDAIAAACPETCLVREYRTISVTWQQFAGLQLDRSEFISTGMESSFSTGDRSPSSMIKTETGKRTITKIARMISEATNRSHTHTGLRRTKDGAFHYIDGPPSCVRARTARPR